MSADRLIIGHCGDSEDLDYLRELMDAGATIGMDRFGMEHVLPDDGVPTPCSSCCGWATPREWCCRTTPRSSAG